MLSADNSITQLTHSALKREFTGWFAVPYNLHFTQSCTTSTPFNCVIDCDHKKTVCLPLPIHGVCEDSSDK